MNIHSDFELNLNFFFAMDFFELLKEREKDKNLKIQLKKRLEGQIDHALNAPQNLNHLKD